MKHFFKASALALLLLGASCSKDEKDNSGEEIAKEKEPLAVDLVANNVIIAGATKEEGVPPAPNGPISLDVSNTSKTALLNEGFEISLDSDANVVGAYVQFKSNDGAVADAYYDINVDDNSFSNKGIKKSLTKRGQKAELTSKVDTDVTLDVDFEDVIEPGTFCYVICVYDAQGNISAPQEVCLTVESWGGNNDLVGFWELTKDEYTQDGETSLQNIGEENCFDQTTKLCDDVMIDIDLGCTTVNLHNILFKEDGTYEYNYKETNKSAIILSEVSCNQSHRVYEFTYNSKGKWAYISEENRLVMIDYSYNSIDAGTTKAEEYDLGEGEELYDVDIELNGNDFSFVDSYDQRVEKYYFIK